MNSQNDVFTLSKYNDALLAGNIGVDANIFGNAAGGWFAGGVNTPTIALTSVQKITFAIDTVMASFRGNLNSAAYIKGATGTTTDGWFVGGSIDSSADMLSSVERITYATDTATPSLRGRMASYVCGTGSAGNTTNGWFYGGMLTTGSGTAGSSVQGITYATDTAIGTVRQTLSAALRYSIGTGTTTYGWFTGGITITPTYLSTVNRITYATDTTAPSVRGNLTTATSAGASLTNIINGWFAGGYTGTANTTNVQMVVFANDTATASLRGNLISPAGNYLNGAGNLSVGWIAGGYVGAVTVSTVQAITYSNDTITASIRGNLSTAVYGAAST